MPSKFTSDALRLPVVSLSAEHLAMGYLLRRNILTYKAPPQNEGYDLICIHPDPRKSARQLRIQVKSRYQTDSDRAFPVKARSFDAFDFLIVAFLNLGYFYRKKPTIDGYREPEFYTFPRAFVAEHHKAVASGWEKMHTKKLDIEQYKNERGFELIAMELDIPYPSRK